jgi:hypothetical protein
MTPMKYMFKLEIIYKNVHFPSFLSSPRYNSDPLSTNLGVGLNKGSVGVGSDLASDTAGDEVQ